MLVLAAAFLANGQTLVLTNCSVDSRKSKPSVFFSQDLFDSHFKVSILDFRFFQKLPVKRRRGGDDTIPPHRTTPLRLTGFMQTRGTARGYWSQGLSQGRCHLHQRGGRGGVWKCSPFVDWKPTTSLGANHQPGSLPSAWEPVFQTRH